jgi:outer membrane biogenesis lipoprotein LolB
MMRRSFSRGVAAALVLSLAAGCAARRPALPTGPGIPFPGFSSAYEQATTGCRDVRSMVASLALSGRAGSNRLAGRIDAGLAAPASIRLELFPPLSFGKPAFILAARDENATLLLPRENRVLRGATPEQIVEALTGVPLGGAELLSVLSGCGLAVGTPGDGRAYQNGWIAADADGSTIYLRQVGGRWLVAGTTRGPIAVQYGNVDAASGRPQSVNVRTTPAAGGAATNLTVKLSDVQINTSPSDDVFAVDVPAGAVPLTLDELKRATAGEKQ